MNFSDEASKLEGEGKQKAEDELQERINSERNSNQQNQNQTDSNIQDGSSTQQ